MGIIDAIKDLFKNNSSNNNSKLIEVVYDDYCGGSWAILLKSDDGKVIEKRHNTSTKDEAVKYSKMLKNEFKKSIIIIYRMNGSIQNVIK